MENKNGDKDKMRKIEAIEKQIWKVYDILKKEGFGVEDSHLLLLFLSLYKDDQLEDFLDLLDEPGNNQILGEPALDYNSQKMSYNHVAAPKEELSKGSKHHIFEQFSHISKNDLLDTYKGVFESVLHQITSSQGRVGGESMQPDELTRFIVNLIDLPKGAKVYNPFAGYGSYAFHLNEGYEYFGQELNPKTWELGKMRLKAHNKLANTTYLCEDSIVNWPNESNKFDLIVSTPPFGMRLNNRTNEGKLIRGRVEYFLIKKGISSLSEKGKLIVLTPQTILTNSGQERGLRKELIEKDLIDTIITLPGGLLSNTGISMAILVIDKDKKRAGKVRFVDAERFVDGTDLRNKKLNYSELIAILKKGHKNAECIRFVDIEEVIASDYSLQVQKYIIEKEIESITNGVRLRDILVSIKGNRHNLPELGKFVRIRDLKNDRLDFKLDVSKIDINEFGKQPIRLIDESCLLIASQFKSAKPTFFEFIDTPIYLSSNIYSFKINKKLVVPAYLINELHEDYVVKQFESYRTGSVIPRIKQKDFLDIVIKLPSLEDQKEKILAEQLVKIRMLQEEQDKLVYGAAVKQFNELASLKHTLGTPRENLSAWTENLIDFFNDKQQEFESLNQSFKDFYEVDIFSVLKEMRNDVNFITDILEKGEDSFQLNRYEKTQISLSDINEIIKDISSHNYNFIIKPLLLKGDDLTFRGIDGHKTPFKSLINNVLTNAHKYGFDEKEKGNEVVFELKEIDDFLLLEIKNNGNPFPRNYYKEKFIEKYSTTDFKKGTGMGGYDINRIATEFGNPDWELMLNKDPAYPVVFKFQFSIKVMD